MKTKLMTAVCVVAVTFAATNSSYAEASDSVAVAVDAIVARPLCFAATILGSAVFVLALPAALTSGSTKKAAEELVVAPAKATFTRPLGDFD
jgi:hypothetical protein